MEVLVARLLRKCLGMFGVLNVDTVRFPVM